MVRPSPLLSQLYGFFNIMCCASMVSTVDAPQAVFGTCPAMSSESLLSYDSNHMCRIATASPVDVFQFVPGSTPLSTLSQTLSVVALYYIVIVSGWAILRNRQPIKLRSVVPVHNLFLSIASGLLLLLFVVEIWPTIHRRGLWFTMCNENGGWTNRLVALYYVNYLMKYYELLDTVFLMLQKKPLTLLHCFHHGATVVLCQQQLVGRTSLTWVPITLNLGVHVVMYLYYFLASMGRRVWWKKYVTSLQIAQFVLDLGFIGVAGYSHYPATYHSATWWHKGRGAGDANAAMVGGFVISLYLVLFVQLYFDRYTVREERRNLAFQEKGEAGELVIRETNLATEEPTRGEEDTTNEVNAENNEDDKAATDEGHTTEDISSAVTDIQSTSTNTPETANPTTQSPSGHATGFRSGLEDMRQRQTRSRTATTLQTPGRSQTQARSHSPLPGWSTIDRGGDGQQDDEAPFAEHVEFAA